jgi:general stress protein YciG
MIISKNILTKRKRYGNMWVNPREGNVFILGREQYVINIGGQNGVSRMAGTKAGGKKAAATNKAKYGKDFYAEIGRKGGKNGHTGGFAANPALAKIAGAKGGRISRRGKAKKTA